MDHEARQRLLQQLEALVFSGVSPLDKDGVAEVKKLCRCVQTTNTEKKNRQRDRERGWERDM